MIVPPAIGLKYAQDRPYVEEVARRAKPLVQQFAEERGYAYVGRLKAEESLAEKIETGRFSSWGDLDDLFACAVVIPTVADEAGVLEFLDSQFGRVVLRQRGGTLKDPAVFRFDATRFIARLSVATPEDAGSLGSILFEVQVRTAFEHAWSVTTHALTYKGGRVDWRRMRLVAQLRAAVEQMDSLVAGFDGLSETISEQAWPEVVAQERIEGFFRNRFESGAIPEELLPASWVRFTANLYHLIRGCHRGPRAQLDQTVDQALECIENGVTALSTNQVPKSISLVQLSLGILADASMARGRLDRYIPLVTDELRSLYPAVSHIVGVFDLEGERSV